MKAALLAIPLLFLMSGPMAARHDPPRPGYTVQGYVNVSPNIGGSFYFGTQPYYGYNAYRPGPGYFHGPHAKQRYKAYKKYLKHRQKMLKKLRKQRRRHHDDYWRDDYRRFRR